MLLKYKDAEIQKDKPNFREAATVPFANKYWKAMKTEIVTLMKTDIATLESIGAWEIVYQDDYMHVIQ